ncbi:DEKNAAC103171 [Brettanomyces naardenensis]|uniref:DEKNAAC103171 n=1 Tax=Brettanomyces naardenensis TaxID=13370 RepID=A0A448YML5_BRENA|nr:DEKNAAC103171 [Brettanomyces naardenensis]
MLCYILCLLLYVQSCFAATIGSALACNYGSGVSSDSGFVAKFYTYISADYTDYVQSSFLASGYTNNGYITSATGVTSPQFSFSVLPGVIATSQLYGVDVTISNITIAYSGYFKGK